jgi:hypothetical protein
MKDDAASYNKRAAGRHCWAVRSYRSLENYHPYCGIQPETQQLTIQPFIVCQNAHMVCVPLCIRLGSLVGHSMHGSRAAVVMNWKTLTWRSGL